MKEQVGRYIINLMLVTGRFLKFRCYYGLQRQTRLAIGIIVAGVVCSFTVMATAPEHVPEEVQEKSWMVSTMAINPGDVAPNLSLFGKVSTPRKANITAAVQANVEQVLVEDGQAVNEGDLLIQLDGRDANLEIMQAQAELDDANAKFSQLQRQHSSDLKVLAQQSALFDLAEKKTARYQQLQSNQLISAALLEESKSQAAQQIIALENQRSIVDNYPHELAKAKSYVDRAQVHLEQAQLMLSRTKVKAPFAGLVSGLSVAPGDRVVVGHELIGLIDISKMEVRAAIASQYINSLRKAMQSATPVQAWAMIDGRQVQLELRQLASEVGAGRSGVDGIFKVQQTDAVVTLGRVVSVLLQLPVQSQVLAVPVQAVYDHERVYLVESGRLRAVNVEVVGERVDEFGNYQLLIRSEELNRGQKLLTTQLARAMTGLKVSEQLLVKSEQAMQENRAS